MPTVLHVSQPTEGGVATYVAGAAADQRERGWNVFVACPGTGELADQLADHGVVHVRWPAGRSPGPGTAGETLRLRRVLEVVAPDVVHLHSSKAGLAGRLAVRGRVPTIFQPHAWSWPAAPRYLKGATVAWERLAARWTGLYVCVCDAEAEAGHAHGLCGRYRVIPNGVDLTHFRADAGHDRRAARARLRIPTDVPLAVCVGRITKQKGQDTLLRAWPAVRARCPDAKLALVGAGDLLEPLRDQAPPSVHFAGPVDDTRAWYAAADVVVLPSRWEGMPLTLLEALAVGRPVVGNDIPGVADTLPADSGVTVEAGDTRALAEALSHRLRHPELARAEGAAAARHAARTADVHRTYDHLAAVTARLAETRHRTVRDRRRWTPGWLGSATLRGGSSR
jgi:glycosyltransferase involved in cell wall biosynthesis